MKSINITVFTTTYNLEEARKFAACAQISKIESFCTWENDVQNDQEFRIMFKTTKNKYKDMEKTILKTHSYDLPAIYAVDVDELHKPYGDWINKSLK